MESEEVITIKPKVLKGIWKNVWHDQNTKVGKDAEKVSAELVRLFVLEAIARAAKIAKSEGSTQIEPEHIEKIAHQLLLDF